ncbi:MAG: hypothetical protein R6U13_03705 [Desulfatiglandaceae bacterium]
MTHEDRGHYAAKHEPGRRVPQELAEKIRSRCKNGELPCSVAFEIAEEEGFPPLEIGAAADLMEIPIVKCRLGLYGYKPDKKIVRPAPKVDPALESAIKESLVNGRLPCARAWAIADKFGIGKMDVSAASETLGIKIRPCQLGSF